MSGQATSERYVTLGRGRGVVALNKLLKQGLTLHDLSHMKLKPVIESPGAHGLQQQQSLSPETAKEKATNSNVNSGSVNGVAGREKFQPRQFESSPEDVGQSPVKPPDSSPNGEKKNGADVDEFGSKKNIVKTPKLVVGNGEQVGEAVTWAKFGAEQGDTLVTPTKLPAARKLLGVGNVEVTSPQKSALTIGTQTASPHKVVRTRFSLSPSSAGGADGTMDGSSPVEGLSPRGDCPVCNRARSMLTCVSCGFTCHGRARKVCTRHPYVIHLMDVTACPKCFCRQFHTTGLDGPQVETAAPLEEEE